MFLRHLGCTFCRETLGEVRQHRSQIESAGARIALVHMSSDDNAARQLFEQYHLGDVPRFADRERRLYRSFELRRGSFLQLFGPRVALRGIAATLRGHRAGSLDGDGLQLAGTFLVHNGRIVKAHRSSDAADAPDYCTFAGSVAS